MTTAITIVRSFSMAGVAFVLCGCASTGVRHIEGQERPLTTTIEADDIRRTVDSMASSMLSFPPLLERCQGHRPVLDVAKISNSTMDHINTLSLTDSLRTRLVRSGLFRFRDSRAAGQDLLRINQENEIGLVDASQAVKPGQQLATEMTLHGNISQIRTTNGRIVDQYYKITMTLRDLRTGEDIWIDEKEIRKEMKRSAF